eukprot:bmy_20363T0
MERCVFKGDAALRFPHRTKCLRGSWRGSAIPDTQPTSRFEGDGSSLVAFNKRDSGTSSSPLLLVQNLTALPRE